MNESTPLSVAPPRLTRAQSRFALRVADLIRHDLIHARPLVIPKNRNVYISGDSAEDIYLIESGQIKLQMIAFEGRCCVLDVHAEGDAFGELCLLGPQVRLETATAMRDS